jgi:hypothetical protein
MVLAKLILSSSRSSTGVVGRAGNTAGRVAIRTLGAATGRIARTQVGRTGRSRHWMIDV